MDCPAVSEEVVSPVIQKPYAGHDPSRRAVYMQYGIVAAL